MFCANCGERNEDGVKFCQKCGAQAGGNVQAQQQNSSVPVNSIVQPTALQNNLEYKKLPILALVSIICLTIGPVFYFLIWNIFHMEGLYGWWNRWWKIWNITEIASFIVGIFIFVKIKKVIGQRISYAIIIMLAINAVANLYYLLSR